jgi:hypothetical protein
VQSLYCFFYAQSTLFYTVVTKPPRPNLRSRRMTSFNRTAGFGFVPNSNSELWGFINDTPTGTFGSGSSSSAGPTGPTGANSSVTGPTGPASNATGPTGSVSVTTGPTGAEITGPTGAQVTGPTGATGPQVTGPTGLTGASLTGPTGAQVTGPTGNAFTGPTGFTGAALTGPTGAQVTGPTGAQITGPTGAQVTGPTGAVFTGPTGAQVTGPTGAVFTGPTGPTGTGFTGPTGAQVTGPTGALSATGGNLFYSSITLGTTGGTAAAFNYYEDYSHVTTFTFGATNTPSMVVRMIRLGNAVSIVLPGYVVLGSSGTAAVITMNTPFPARMRPEITGVGIATAVTGYMRAYRSGTIAYNGVWLANASGSMTLHADVDLTGGLDFFQFGFPYVGWSTTNMNWNVV